MDLFLHIPKTAGTTIDDIAKRMYPLGGTHIVGSPNWPFTRFLAELPQAQRDSFRYVGGHFHYGFHRTFMQPCRYITMLRDPAEVARSVYLYLLRWRDHPGHAELMSKNSTFLQWLEGRGYDYFDNHQLRFLLGKLGPAPLSRSDLNEGKALLAEEFAAFGLVDRFDESVLFFQDALGWTTPFYRKLNVYSTPEDGKLLTPEALAILHQRHAFEFELVDFARGLFHARVLQAGKPFAERLERFKRDNLAWTG